MNWTNIIPWVISGAMFVIALITLIKNSRKTERDEYNEETGRLNGIQESLIKVNMKLDQVCATTNETRSDIKAMSSRVADVENRVAVLESRVDTIEKRG